MTKLFHALLVCGWFVGCCFAQTPALKETPVCYSCFFQDAGIQPDQKLIPYFQSFKPADALVSGDVRFILWRATGKEDCGVLGVYRNVTGDADQIGRASCRERG